MKDIWKSWKKSFRGAVCSAVALAFLGSSLVMAQDSQNSSPATPAQQQSSTASAGWRQFQGGAPTPTADPPPSQAPGQANTATQNPYQPYSSSNDSSNVADPPAQAPSQAPGQVPAQANAPTQNSYQPYGSSDDSSSSSNRPTIPPRLVLQSGAFITVRTDQMLSSNQSKPGDAFTATLQQPLVVNGLVVAARGETVGGVVVEAKRAGRIKGVSQLAVQLTSLTLVDGRQAPVRTQLIAQRGPTSKGRDAGTIVTTTGLGAAVGAAANGGIGAAVGAGAGAIVGTVGVLLTRGHPTVIYPESELTFRLESPVAVSTVKDPEAFHYVVEDAYAQQSLVQKPTPAPPSLCSGYGCPPPFYYAGPYYPYYPYPYFGFFGPTFYVGPRLYGGFRR
jgi:hypothetical protein